MYHCRYLERGGERERKKRKIARHTHTERNRDKRERSHQPAPVPCISPHLHRTWPDSCLPAWDQFYVSDPSSPPL